MYSKIRYFSKQIGFNERTLMSVKSRIWALSVSSSSSLSLSFSLSVSLPLSFFRSLPSFLSLSLIVNLCQPKETLLLID